MPADEGSDETAKGMAPLSLVANLQAARKAKEAA